MVIQCAWTIYWSCYRWNLLMQILPRKCIIRPILITNLIIGASLVITSYIQLFNKLVGESQPHCVHVMLELNSAALCLPTLRAFQPVFLFLVLCPINYYALRNFSKSTSICTWAVYGGFELSFKSAVSITISQAN